jgi:branched-chain amino acid transport system ATP-binding protein
MTALGGEALTVLFVEHDMDIVERYADRVVAFYAGRVIADAVPAVALASDDVRRYVTGSPDSARTSPVETHVAH